MTGARVASGRTGWYLRVLSCGYLQAGDTVTLHDRPYPQWPIARVTHAMYAPDSDPATIGALAMCPALPGRWRAELARRTGQTSHHDGDAAKPGRTT